VSGSSQVVRVPDRVLRAPDVSSLPEPMPLRRMVGPSAILVGLSIGSGEFVLWPRLTAEWGFALFWACWVGLTLQFFLKNMEIERRTLATGESAVVGFVRLHRVFGPVFLLCGTLPWIWPGWATGAATLVSWSPGAAFWGWPSRGWCCAERSCPWVRPCTAPSRRSRWSWWRRSSPSSEPSPGPSCRLPTCRRCCAPRCGSATFPTVCTCRCCWARSPSPAPAAR